ncbi:MAG: very short patch repair endonuclease [Deltaproteobacteria bacterium]|nr:MAG: very short patch repair endonuclease [Deltaproteobacteria bacterium]
MHPTFLPGTPDFFFPAQKMALFVDGCFWHGCAICKRPLPVQNAPYWRRKITGNIARRAEVIRVLRRRGMKSIRIWEHELRGGTARTYPRLAALLSQS